MSIQKGKNHQISQNQGFNQQRYAHPSYPFQHQSGTNIIDCRPNGTDVGFHVAAGAQGFPQQPPQQGGGSGGPPQLGGGGNRMPPQQQQQHAPSQQQVPPPQQQLPGPTSTPPGAEMGKGPHLQQAIPQGQIPSYGVQNAARQNPSQQFYQPRAPTTRISNHRTGPVVGMQANVGGQQMYPQHVQIPQMQAMYANVLPLAMGQTPMYSNHGLFQPRHNNQSTSAPFYAQPGQIMVHTYPSYNPGQPSASFAYYPQLAGRPSAAGAGPPGGPGGQQVGNPGVPGAGTQNVPMMPIGGAPTGSVVPGMAPGGSDVTGGPQQQGSVTSHPGVNQGGNKPKRKHAIDIVDPKTLKVVDVASDSKGSGTPPHSGESSARETPQPVPGAGLNLAADFAARVYKVANEEPSPPLQQSQLQQQAASFVPEHVLQQQVVNGPLVMEQPNEMGIQNSPVDSGNPTDKLTTPSSSSDVVPDVVLDVFRQQVQEHQAIPVVINKEVQEAGGTPVVSAKTNGPSVELVHRREPFPALKSTPAGTSSSSSSSSPSRRKQQSTSAAVSSSEKPQTVASAPSAVFSQLGPVLSTEAPVLTATQSTPEVPTCPTPKPPRDSAVAAPPAGSKLVTGAPAVPASAEPKASLALSNMPHPGTVAASKKTGPPPQVDIPAFPSTAVVKDKSVISTSSRATKGPISSQSDPPPAVPRSGVGKPPARGPAAAVRSAKGVELPSATRQQTVVSTPPASARPVSRSPTPPVIPPVIEETKQQNGEHTEIITEGKATSKTKQKRNNQQKMKEINRKGAEKEGTDMDAFSEPPIAAPEEPIRPSPTQTPPLTSTTSTVGPASVPDSVQAQPAPHLENQNSSKEKLQSDVEKDKMVAARNEANTKASVVSALKDKDKDEVIENIPPKINAPLPLKHNYKEDQWSPNNPDGKKKYEREFLMQLQHTPQAKKKPDNIPACCEAVLKDRLNKASRLTDISRGPHETFSPAFTKTTSFRAAPQKRGSQQGKAKNSSKPLISVSIKSDVKLHESENAWKPVRLRQKDNVDETAKTEELYKRVRGILNKLTPQKFQTLVSQVQSLPIDTNERLQGVIDLVFEKAVDEPSYSVAYAQMCKVLRTIQASGDNKDPSKPGQQDVNFQKLLLARCQTEFERNKGDAHRSEKLKEMEATTDPEKKKELQIDLDEIERKLRMKSVGNVRFIGELFKLQMLTTNIMHSCIKHLLEARDEESLECLCKLLTTIGKELENKGQNLNEYFNQMRDISRQRGHVSSRVRFMLQDVIDLKAGNWVPRRDDSNPKTIDQIQKEAERESLDRDIAIGNQPPMRGGRQDDRGGGGGDRRKHRGGSGVSEDGWHNVSGSRVNRNVDPTKLRVKLPDLSESLGSMVQFESWGRGAGAVNSDSDRIQSFPHTSNAYSALSDMDDKKLNNPSNRSTKGKHGSSSSVERDRVVQSGGKKYIDNSNERYTVSGNGPHSSRSSSRESSSVRREEDLPSTQANVAVQLQQSSVEPQAVEESRKLCAERSHSEVVQGTMCVLDEFIGNINYEETAQSIVEMFPPSNMADFVGQCLNSMLERSTLNRVNVGRLLSHLINVKVLTMEQFLSGFKIISEVADDLAIDVPKVWLYLAEILVPMICSEVLSFSELKTAAQGLHRLVVEILHLLVKDKGPLWVREKWDAAGIEWTDFISSPSEIDALIKENKLEFTVGPPGSVESPQKATFPMEEVQVKLVQFLKQPSNVFDHLVNWITANVGADVKKPEFIRALMTAICEVAFNQNNSKKVDEAVLLKHQVLIQRYVDNDEELELHCLYAVQEFNYKLEQPQGLLCNIFHSLWDFSFISSDTFIRWESSKDPAFQQGKGIALKSLTAFFTALREGEDDDSEES